MVGEVVARDGDTLTLANPTLAGATVSLSEGYFEYLGPTVTAQVSIGPTTIVTAEGNSTLTNLDYNSIAVGQRIAAIGTYTAPTATSIVLNAVSPTTGSTAGQVRLLPTQLWGDLVSAAAGGLTLNLQTIDDLPVSAFSFAGNGPATPVASAFSVATPGANFGGTAAGTPLWVDGFVTPYGAAPPDFTAYDNLQNAPTPDQVISPVNLEPDVPASLQAQWISSTVTGTTTPFSTATSAGLVIGTGTTAFSGYIYVGPESIPLTSVAPVTIVPNTVADCVVMTNLPAGEGQQPCQPLYSYGPLLVAATSTAAAYDEILEYNNFATFITNLKSQISSTTPVTQFTANGYYNRATNIFTATNIDVVL
jgi:hypothetical protein